MRHQAKEFMALLALCAVVLGGSAAGASAACSNEALRNQQRAVFLPDCRAYEQVSATDKAGSDVFQYGLAHATPDATGFAYSSTGAFGSVVGAPYQSIYTARRSPAGWSTRSISPPSDPVTSLSLSGALNGLTADLSKAIFISTRQLTPGAPPSIYAGNYYIRDDASGTYQSINPEAPTNPYGAGNAFDFTPGFERLVFGFTGGLTPEAGESPQVYSYENGTFELASRLPDESVPHEAFLGSEGGPPSGTKDNALSRDGSRLFFSSYYAPGAPRSLFMRVGDTVTDISLSRATEPDPLGTAAKTFVGASEDGGRVFFISCEKLTDDSTAVFEGGEGACSHDLYMYETETGSLIDLTTADPNGARVISAVQVSEEGNVVYFVARGDLAGGAGVPGEPKIYAWHEGEIDFVATVSEADFRTIYPGGAGGAKATPDGSVFAFLTSASQPGFDNQGTSQAYVYRLGESPVCASCDTAVPPAAVEFSNVSPGNQQEVRNLSDDGQRLVFQTAMPLSASDSNGQVDVYLWENGEVSLISGGQSDRPSEFAEASPSGDDVFFYTRQRLLPSDRDGLMDVYSARVGGGFATPAPGPAPCLGSACQVPGAAPPAPPAPATESVRGPARKPVKRCGKSKRRVISKGKATCVNKKKPGKPRRGAGR